MVMDRLPARRRIFDPFIIHQVAAGEKVIDRAGSAAIFDARRQRSATAPIDADVPARFLTAGPRGDVDKAGGAQAVLGGQRSGDE